MNEEKLDQVFASVEPSRRAILKKMVLSAGFVIPIIASFSVTDLAASGMGSVLTSTVSSVSFTITSSTTTVTSTMTTILTTTP